MNPSIELRMRTMIRALNETIIPAVDPEDSLAQEQAGLLLGHLHVLLQHEGREQTMCKIEHGALKLLADALIEASSGGHASAAATARVRDLPDDVDTDTLSHAIEALIIDSGIDGSDAFKQASKRLVIEHGREATRRSRVWFKAMGFDHEPDALPNIDSLFGD
ncbi:MAG: hypothetical protein ACI9BW_004350 [Gammaproteobacteria bacterium]|jgi:hypothetical protein